MTQATVTLKTVVSHSSTITGLVFRQGETKQITDPEHIAYYARCPYFVVHEMGDEPAGEATPPAEEPKSSGRRGRRPKAGRAAG